MEDTVLREFREMLYGGLFGLGAATIDIVMHARMHGQGLIQEIMHPGPGMTFYRALYFAFGIIIGWALWRSHKKERRFRLVLQQFCDIIDLFDGHATVIYANAQALLLQETCMLPENATASVGVLYEHVQQVRVLTNKLSELANA